MSFTSTAPIGKFNAVETEKITITGTVSSIRWSNVNKHPNITLLNSGTTAKLSSIHDGPRAVIANTGSIIGTNTQVWNLEIHYASNIQFGMAEVTRDLNSLTPNNDNISINYSASTDNIIKCTLSLTKLTVEYGSTIQIIDMTAFTGKTMYPWISDIVGGGGFSVSIRLDAFMKMYVKNGIANIDTDSNTLLINGTPAGGGGGIQNPLTSDLEIGAFNITDNGVASELLKVVNASTYYAGTGSGAAITTATGNVLIGGYSGGNLTTQNGNVGCGDFSLHNKRAGNNVAVGQFSQFGNFGGTNTGSDNTSVGWSSLYSADTASQNVAIGAAAASTLLDGSDNVVIGVSANSNVGDSTVNSSIVIGANSSSGSGTNRCVIGVAVTATKDNQIMLGDANVTEIVNAGNGVCDLGSATNTFKDLYVSGNIIGGGGAGAVLTEDLDIGAFNITDNGVASELLKVVNASTYYAGTGSGTAITTATESVFIGENCGGAMTTNSFNVGVGSNALQYATGNTNVAVGRNSQTGALGTNTGIRNTSVGSGSLVNCESASTNVAIGQFAGSGLRNGDDNTMIGYSVNDNILDDGSSGCIVIGNASRSNGGTNRTAIGNALLSTQDNQIMLGDANVTELINAGNGVCDLGSATNTFKDLYLDGNVNGLTPVGGLYSGLVDGTLVSGGVLTTMVPGLGNGSLTFPANGFSVGDIFRLVCTGDIPVGDADDTITVTLTLGGIQLAQIVMAMTEHVGSRFALEADFQVRTTGETGEIITDLVFNSQIGKVSSSIELSTVDQTVPTTIDLTAQFAGDLNSTIQTRVFYIKKQY